MNNKTKFNIGDKVKVLNGNKINNYTGSWDSNMEEYVGGIYTIASIIDDYDNDRIGYTLEGCNYTLKICESDNNVNNDYIFDERGLELVKDNNNDKKNNNKPKFKVGDMVKVLYGGCIDNYTESWCSYMNTYIDRVLTINKIITYSDGRVGYEMEEDKYNDYKSTFDERGLELNEDNNNSDDNNTNNKYEILKDKEYTIKFRGRTLYRIKALRDIGNIIKKGDIGGYIEKEYNLSQCGNCWIFDNAMAMDYARVFDDACMYDNSKIFDNGRLYNTACIYDYAEIHNDCRVYGNGRMYDYTSAWCNSIVNGGYMEMNSYIEDSAILNEEGFLSKNAYLSGRQILRGSLYSEVDDFIDLSNPEGRSFTAVLKKDKVLYNIGCQIEITEENFIDRIYNDCEVMGKGLEEYPYRKHYLKLIDMTNMYFNKYTKKEGE